MPRHGRPPLATKAIRKSIPASKAKRPFDIDEIFRRLRQATKPFAKAAMFELAERGFDTVFQQLVGCVISIRTRDEVSLPTSIRLLEAAPTPADVAALSAGAIDKLISACTFHEPKARTIRAIAQRTVDEFDGDLPADAEVLMSFAGVGPKCAHLALGVARGMEHISVDIHVHRVVNRWGYVRTTTPPKTMAALEGVLPRKYWIEINRLLVPFGKHICTGQLPKCSTCPLLEFCRQVGVTKHR
jgi:endonuclease-3